MREASALLGLLTRSHYLAAIARIDLGETGGFAESTKFDLSYLGKRYPPKRVTGLALNELTGQVYTPRSFASGDDSSCFRALKRCGFTIVPKDSVASAALGEVLEEILSLQTQYASTNTPAMDRRGKLIRDALPTVIRQQFDVLEPLFSARGLSLEVEGSDGKGRKNESPWVRLFDPVLPPSATMGWYVVLHFSRLGDRFYATVGCGATRFKDGSLVDIAAAELGERVQWARSAAGSTPVDLSAFQHPIALHGNSLSAQFERATASARAYSLADFNEAAFWDDVRRLCLILVELYEKERLGQAPESAQPELVQAQQAIEWAVSGATERWGGQGRGLAADERRAVELRAMAVAKTCLEAAGFGAIKDESGRESYDFSATKDGARWLIEVKGTTSPKMDAFLLTANELALHQAHAGQTVLVLVSGIGLKRQEGVVSAHGGVAEMLCPWLPGQWQFVATAFRATRST